MIGILIYITSIRRFYVEKYVCYCNKVTQKEIEAAIKQGARSLQDIEERTGAGNGGECSRLNPSGKCCKKDILRILSKR